MRAEMQRFQCGFTLVEVLVALAIVAFGLVAVFGQLSQSTTAASRLREKTLAEWVALNQLAELRLSGEYPGIGTRSDDVEMAGSRWHYDIKISETQGNYMRRADVSVSYTDNQQRPLATVVGFIGQPLAVAGSQPGLPLPGPDGQLVPEGESTLGTDGDPDPSPLVPPETPPDSGNGSPGSTE